MQQMRSQRGMSLAETVLYVALFGILIFSLSAFLIQIVYQTQIKHRSISEVEQQGERVIRLVTQTVRNSTGILSPTVGTSGSVLSVSSATAEKNPTIFSVSDGILQITEGATASIGLTSSRVAVSDFTVQNLSQSGTPGTARIRFTLGYKSNSARNEYNYSKTFYGTATIR